MSEFNTVLRRMTANKNCHSFTLSVPSPKFFDVTQWQGHVAALKARLERNGFVLFNSGPKDDVYWNANTGKLIMILYR